MATALPVGSFLRTSAWILTAMVTLSAANTFLARTERAESAAEAARLFSEGRSLMRRGENAAAIGRIQDAILIDRSNRDYSRTLAEARLAAGQTREAEATLTDLLQSDSTDGLANLLMGRVLARENRYVEAVSYYHRAVYGAWKEDEAGNRLRARFELIDLLARQNSKGELLAELLPVQDALQADPKARVRFGRLFLLAGSPGRAASIFQGVVNDDPANAEARAGLGEADFAQGNYRAAQRNFAAAIRLAPDDNASRRRLELCDQLLAMDPGVRGLGAAERLRRSRQLVELTIQSAGECPGANASGELKNQLATAALAARARVNEARQGEVAEALVDQALRLWQLRGKECTSPADASSPVALLMARLAE